MQAATRSETSQCSGIGCQKVSVTSIPLDGQDVCTQPMVWPGFCTTVGGGPAQPYRDQLPAKFARARLVVGASASRMLNDFIQLAISDHSSTPHLLMGIRRLRRSNSLAMSLCLVPVWGRLALVAAVGLSKLTLKAWAAWIGTCLVDSKATAVSRHQLQQERE